MSEKRDAREEKQKRAEKPRKSEGKEGKEENEGKEEKEEKKKQRRPWLKYLAVIIIMGAVAYATYFAFNNYTQVPFSTFKSNFYSAKRVALATTYSNLTQYSRESQCITLIAEFVGKNMQRNSTIDLLLIDRQNASCIHSPIVIGQRINIMNQSAASCVGIANSEPSIFLNYSASNSTTITMNHLYVYANDRYLLSCPIAVDLG